MRVRQLLLLERVHDEAPAGPECGDSYGSMTPGAEDVLSGDRELLKKAFRRCRNALEKFMVLAKYDRFRACVRELDTKRGQPRRAVDVLKSSSRRPRATCLVSPISVLTSPASRRREDPREGAAPPSSEDVPPDMSARFQNNASGHSF